jgi:hypothetical protein
MKPLKRYNVDTVFERTWNNDGWEERLQIEESDNGDWVKCEDVKKLEEQMGHLLDLSKLLLQNIEPDKFANGVGLSVVMITREMWDDFQKLIADIEGENQ